jgi:hypothetical protein
MGTRVRYVVYDHLRRKDIPESEIPAQFDDVVKVLNESFGGSARVIIYKTLVELYQQYSMRIDFHIPGFAKGPSVHVTGEGCGGSHTP